MKFSKPGLFIITALLLAILASCGLIKNEDRETSPAPDQKTGTVIFSPVLEEDGEMDCAASGISYFEVTLKSEGEESALQGPFSCEDKVIKLTDLTPGYRDITLEGKNIDGITLYTETIVNYHVGPEFLDAGKVTLNAIDRQAPSVVSVFPTDGATVQTENLAIAVEFNEPIDSATLTEATFTLSDGVNLISGTITYSKVTATLMPSLKKGATYVATVTTGVKDLSGNPLEKNYSWSFSTATGYIDSLSPEVVSTNPTDGATDVPVNTTITAAFNEKMDPATIDTTSFLVSDGAVNIEGAVTYDQNTKTATFSPATPLDTDKRYTVTVTEGAKDSAGNSLTAFPWVFRTTVDQIPVVTVCPFIPNNEAECDSFTIQGGIDLAESGTTIRVAEGIYYENVTLKSGITLEGGWDIQFSHRDWRLQRAILDGSGISGIGSKLISVNDSSDILIDGMIFQNGYHGIYLYKSANVTVTNNLSMSNQGTGISTQYTSGLIANNEVRNNGGSGIAASVSGPGDMLIEKNTIINNGNTGSDGGGLKVDARSGGRIIVKQNLILSNLGGIGGGLDIGGFLGGYVSAKNNFIANNTANNFGGGVVVRIYGGRAELLNNTISMNTGTGLLVMLGTVTIKNTISYGNSGGDISVDNRASLGVSYSNICDTDGVTPYTGTYNKCEDPLFIAPLQNNFHLQQTSPMIDMATPVEAPDYDIDGDVRPHGSGIDIGADEVIP